MTPWQTRFVMEKYFDARTLIAAVKTKPILYSKNDPNISNGDKKAKLVQWKAVCREVYSDYNSLDASKRAERLYEVRRRWKNLRTCFTRDLALQRQADALGKSRKRYEYFNQLRFLLDQYDVPRGYAKFSEMTDADDRSDDNDDATSDTVIDDTVSVIRDSVNGLSNSVDIKTENVEYINIDSEPAKSFDEPVDYIPRTTELQLIEIIRDLKRGENDDDKQFILSLLPTFKRLDDEKKFEAKIEILKILQKLTYS